MSSPLHTRSPLCEPLEHRLSRRRWLGGLAGAAAGGFALSSLSHGPLADELARRQRQVLFIWLDGGISQFESWDPKPGTQFGGPFRAISTSVPSIQICELLPRTALRMHHLAIVRSLCTQDNSHSAGVARIQRGDPKNRGVTYPYFGSAVSHLLGPGTSGLPAYLWIKPGSGGFIAQDGGFLGPQFGPLALGDGKPPEQLHPPADLLPHDADERDRLRAAANARYAQGRSPDNGEAQDHVFGLARELARRNELFDSSTFSPQDVARYGTHEFGRHMLLARRMLEAGITFVKVNSYGWDTHGDNFNGHLTLVAKVDQAFAALIEDLAVSGQLEHVLVIMISEFGRTPRINGHVGRDHWPEAWSCVMGGCGIKRGVVVGATNENGTEVTTEPFDIGHMFHTWFRALGIDPATTQYDHGGQPLPIAHEEHHAVNEVLDV